MIPDNILLKASKPGRYTGGEYGQIVKDKAKVSARFAFCFPDTYEIGMSNLGVRILYSVLNSHEDIWCERAYAPWTDMEELMREHNIPLYALESGDPLKEFDFVGFTLQYELCYTNVLNMLSLSGIPLCSKDREENDPIIIGGGPCAYNPEPVADFFDIFSIGEGEESIAEVTRLYIEMKEKGTYSRKSFLYESAKLEGFYVPSLYELSYFENGKIKEVSPLYDDIPVKIKKRIMSDLDKSPFPEMVVMPFIETVHDRIMIEVYRGCIHGCRFCQAGMVYRPLREKSPEVLNFQAKTLIENTGYSEISLSSLSISDYSCLDNLTDKLLEWTNDKKINLSLPSLRANSFTRELMEKISTVRMGGITFAPEAGTQRLRDVINKNIDEETLLKACRVAFEAGKNSIKLYFMQGHPTERDEDLDGIAEMASKVVKTFYQTPERNKARPVQVTLSVACFIPKPFTPFQWEAQDSLEESERKQNYLNTKIGGGKIRYNYHSAKISRIEGVFARGNRTLSKALLKAHEKGMKFDAWDEHFSYEKWVEVFEETGIDPAFFANRKLDEDEILPWDIIDAGVSKSFLLSERKKAYNEQTSPLCSENCLACGAHKLNGGKYCCGKTK